MVCQRQIRVNYKKDLLNTVSRILWVFGGLLSVCPSLCHSLSDCLAPLLFFSPLTRLLCSHWPTVDSGFLAPWSAGLQTPQPSHQTPLPSWKLPRVEASEIIDLYCLPKQPPWICGQLTNRYIKKKKKKNPILLSVCCVCMWACACVVSYVWLQLS